MKALENAPSSIARRWGKSLAVIVDPTIRQRSLEQKLADVDAKVCVRVLANALRAASTGDNDAKVLVDTLAQSLDVIFDDTQREELREVAVLFCEHAVLALFDDTRAAPFARAPDRGSLAEKGIPLGVRKSRARVAVDDELDRLLLDPDPSVVANVCLNPRMTEDLMVRMASRSSAFAPILEVIARSRFGARVRVRKSVVMNKHCPTALATSLLASMDEVSVREVAENTFLHSSVRDRARQVLSDKMR